MKVFEFKSGKYRYCINGNTEEEAKNNLFEEVGEMEIDSVEEIPESRWDDNIVGVHEDDDKSKEPFFKSIREIMCDNTPHLIYSNDESAIS